MVVSEVFREPMPDSALAGQATVLQALQAGIAANLAVLDDPAFTGTGRSSAEVLGVPGSVLAEALASHLVHEIMLRGSGGGPLAPLADQLNHDVTHLQGQRIEGMLAQLAGQVKALAHAGSTPVTPGKPARLLPRPVFLAGREDLLADLGHRLTSGDGPGPRMVALSGLGGTGKTSVAVEYAHRHLDEVGVAWQFPAEDTAVLAAGFTDLAAQLGIGGAAGSGDPVAAVHSVLGASPAGWLLIFDNVPSLDQVWEFLPPAGDGAVSVHRLVQAVTTDQMPADLAQGWRQAAAALIEAALPEDPQQPADWPVFAALLPHAQAVLDLTSDGIWRIAVYLGRSGSYPSARDLFQLIADPRREDDTYGAEHPDTLTARHELARWTGAAGDAAAARDQYAALAPVDERVLGASTRTLWRPAPRPRALTGPRGRGGALAGREVATACFLAACGLAANADLRVLTGGCRTLVIGVFMFPLHGVGASQYRRAGVLQPARRVARSGLLAAIGIARRRQSDQGM